MKSILIILSFLYGSNSYSCTLKNLTGKGDPRLQILIENEIVRTGHKMSYGETKSDFTVEKVTQGKKAEFLVLKDSLGQVIEKKKYPINRVEIRKIIQKASACKTM